MSHRYTETSFGDLKMKVSSRKTVDVLTLLWSMEQVEYSNTNSSVPDYIFYTLQ